MSIEKMTLEQVVDALRNSPNYANLWSRRLADAIDAHLTSREVKGELVVLPEGWVIPEGWCLVPDTPSERMLDDGWPYPEFRDFDREGAYADITAHAPRPPAAQEAAKPVGDVVIPDGSAHAFPRLNQHLPHGTKLYAHPAEQEPANADIKLDPDTNECSPDPVVRKAYADGYDVGYAHGEEAAKPVDGVLKLVELIHNYMDASAPLMYKPSFSTKSPSHAQQALFAKARDELHKAMIAATQDGGE